jgi:hypothetical protein
MSAKALDQSLSCDTNLVVTSLRSSAVIDVILHTLMV